MVAKARAGTALAEQKGGAVAASNAVPTHLQKAADQMGKGNENVTAADLTIPRIGLIQGLSPQIDPDSPKFIPGATMGQMFNSLTNELYDTIYLTDLFYRKEFGLFVKRKAGGGFRGSFPTEIDAVTAMEAMEDKANIECIETGVHFCLMLEAADPEKEFGMDNMKAVGEFVLFFTVTKLKVSRNLNSLIRNRGQNLDRWAGVFRLDSGKETNAKGTFYNYVVCPAGWVNAEVNAVASQTFDQIAAGKREKIDREGAVDEDAGDPSASSKM